jgi:GntR family transcriptional regulator
MFLAVDPSSGFPVYRQIMDQVRRMVVAGRLVPGEKLPSIRELAATLGLNVLTVGKAYGELERDHVIEMRRGLGMYVLAQRAPGDLARSRPPPPGVRESAGRFVLEAAQAGLSRAAAQALVDRAWQQLVATEPSEIMGKNATRRQK